MKIKKGDNVIVISGKDKGNKGKVLESLPKNNKVIVEGVNTVKKHQKPRGQNSQGGIFERPAPIDVSNVAIADPKTGKPTRVGYKIESGKKVRFAKKSGSTLR